MLKRILDAFAGFSVRRLSKLEGDALRVSNLLDDQNEWKLWRRSISHSSGLILYNCEESLRVFVGGEYGSCPFTRVENYVLYPKVRATQKALQRMINIKEQDERLQHSRETLRKALDKQADTRNV